MGSRRLLSSLNENLRVCLVSFCVWCYRYSTTKYEDNKRELEILGHFDDDEGTTERTEGRWSGWIVFPFFYYFSKMKMKINMFSILYVNFVFQIGYFRKIHALYVHFLNENAKLKMRKQTGSKFLISPIIYSFDFESCKFLTLIFALCAFDDVRSTSRMLIIG